MIPGLGPTFHEGICWDVYFISLHYSVHALGPFILSVEPFQVALPAPQHRFCSLHWVALLCHPRHERQGHQSQLYNLSKDNLPPVTAECPNSPSQKTTLDLQTWQHNPDTPARYLLSGVCCFALFKDEGGMLLGLPGVEPVLLEVKALSPNCWTAREFPLVSV